MMLSSLWHKLSYIRQHAILCCNLKFSRLKRLYADNFTMLIDRALTCHDIQTMTFILQQSQLPILDLLHLYKVAHHGCSANNQNRTKSNGKFHSLINSSCAISGHISGPGKGSLHLLEDLSPKCAIPLSSQMRATPTRAPDK